MLSLYGLDGLKTRMCRLPWGHARRHHRRGLRSSGSSTPIPVPAPARSWCRSRRRGSTPPTSCSAMGLYPAPPGYPPDIPGMELAGEVVGRGTGCRSLGRSGTGSCPSPEEGPRPSWPSSPRARPWPCPTVSPGTRPGASPRRSAPPTTRSSPRPVSRAGERVLISGAAGGVGVAAVQLAHAAGAFVVASVRSAARHAEVCRSRCRRGHRARPGPRARSLRRLTGTGGSGRCRRRAPPPGRGRTGGGDRGRGPGPRSSSTSWP